jgi:twitching motility two-component system response regulator PilG
MSEKKYCLVGTLGLLEHEISLLQSIFRMSNNRDRIHFKLIQENLPKAHIIIATIDNEAAMDKWQTICKSVHPPVLVAVSPKELGKFPDHSFSRPFSPTKVLAVLDQIFDKELANLFDEKIFHGEETSAYRVFNASSKISHGAARALVVDDSKTVQNQIIRELTSSKLNADIAETGEQALEMVVKKHYDIIFLDVVLPGMDGYQVCKNIKRNPDIKHIPVVMLTSKSSPFDKVRGSMAGCNAYLTKPVDYDKFHHVLDQFMVHENGK